MGMLDHRRTWKYDVSASTAECLDAFGRAFSGSGGLVAKARWDLQRTNRSAVAVYQGRKGLGALGSLSKTSAHEADTAIGSTVTFRIEDSANGRTTCSMWLSSSGRAGIGGLLGATSDARFIRPYMQAVEKEMRRIDHAVRISTN
jgi:hypothetical protein